MNNSSPKGILPGAGGGGEFHVARARPICYFKTMEEKDFQEELERIRLDVESFARPPSACEYFHGREKLFEAEQLKKAVSFFLESLQKRFED